MYYLDYENGISVNIVLYTPPNNSGTHYRLTHTDTDSGQTIQVRRYEFSATGLARAKAYARGLVGNNAEYTRSVDNS